MACRDAAGGNGDGHATCPLDSDASSQRPLDQIMRRHAAMVFRVCYNITRNTHDAEDATQAAFLALHQQLKTAAPIRNVGGWLQQVAQRISLDILRSGKRRKAREKVHSSITPTPVENPDREESKRIVAEELEQLPPKYRLPLILHYFGGMSHEEISREMNCKSGTLRVRLYRAKELLGRKLSARGMDMTGMVLGGMLGQIIHSTVTESIIAAAARSSAGLSGLGTQSLSPHAAEIWRAGTLTAKAKVAVGVGVLLATATTMTISVPPAVGIGVAAASAVRRLPEKLDAIIQAVTRPVMRNLLPSFQASATQPSLAPRPASIRFNPAIPLNQARTAPAPFVMPSTGSSAVAADRGVIHPGPNIVFTPVTHHANAAPPPDFSNYLDAAAQQSGSSHISLTDNSPGNTPTSALAFSSPGTLMFPGGLGTQIQLQLNHGVKVVLAGSNQYTDTPGHTLGISANNMIVAANTTFAASYGDEPFVSDATSVDYLAAPKSTPSKNIVPEPTGLILFVGGAILLRRRRRRPLQNA
jgi:RNA polymerase sigma factor (sigma-70 family)